MPIMKMQLGWSLDKALELVRKIQPTILNFQYHMVLGGGVLNRGYSVKDLDLYVLPFGDTGIPADLDGLKACLAGHLGEPAPLGYTPRNNHYPPDATYGEDRYTYTLDGERIDVFIA